MFRVAMRQSVTADNLLSHSAKAIKLERQHSTAFLWKKGVNFFGKWESRIVLARIYLRIVPLRLMGIDEETAKELACRLEDEAQEGAAD